MFVSSFLCRLGTSPEFRTLLMASTICSFTIPGVCKEECRDFCSLDISSSRSLGPLAHDLTLSYHSP